MILTPREVYEKYKPNSEKKVECRCDECGKITTTSYANYNRSQEKKEWNGSTQCKSCSCKYTATKRKGIIPHNKGRKFPHLGRENSKMWKGGRYLGSDGYWNVFVGDGAYKKEHRLVMEDSLNRNLLPGERVHHIDLNKQNNSIENLVLVSSEQEHKDLHMSLQYIGVLLLKAGYVRLNKEGLEYVFTEDFRRKIGDLK